MDTSEPQILPPCRSGRRSRCDTNSPEFEFWMVRNPSCPQPSLLSADELFLDGVLLPLHLLPLHKFNSQPHQPEPTNSELPVIDLDPKPGMGPQLSTATTEFPSASKRWKDIFKKSEKKNTGNGNIEDKDKEKKKERKSGNRASSAELNINIWPFSRSRSAGNAGTRPKFFAGASGTRKVNSAPCSRSNSAGDSKSRKWPSSPGRPGVHLGRSSPVWQVRRGNSGSKNSESFVRNPEKISTTDGRRSETPSTGGSARARVLNLNVPMCIGNRHHLSCRSDENSAIGMSGGGDGGSDNSRGNGGGRSGSSVGGNIGNGGNRFNLRTLFHKKSVLTSH